MAVLVDGELARGRRSARLQGRFTASDAPTRLLGGTGLMARYTSQEAFTLLPAQAVRNVAPLPAEMPKVEQPLDRRYAGAVQAALKNSCALAAHSSGTYRAVLQLWIGRFGEVRHSRLLASTGDRSGQRPGGKPARRAGDAGDARYAGPAADHPVAAEDDGQGHGNAS